MSNNIIEVAEKLNEEIKAGLITNTEELNKLISEIKIIEHPHVDGEEGTLITFELSERLLKHFEVMGKREGKTGEAYFSELINSSVAKAIEITKKQ